MQTNVLKQAKREMGIIVREIQFDNIELTRQYLNKYLDFLNSLKELPQIDPKKYTRNDDTDNRLDDFILEEQKPQPTPVTVYTLERKLRGAVISLNGGTFISERTIRENGYKHGDKLIIKNAEQRTDYVKYTYEVVEKSTVEDAPNRVQLDFCIVKKDKHLGFIVENYKNGEIRVDGIPHPFVISNNDVMEYGLQDGELVDCAYYANNLATFKVIWRHEIEEQEKKPPAPTSKRTKKTKPEEDEDTNDEPNSALDYEYLKGKQVVVVTGSDKLNHRYQQTCDKLGIELTLLTGDEGYLRMESVIKKADAVVSVIPHVAHHGSNHANELTKEYDIPYGAAVRPGINHILLKAEEAMKKSERVPATV